MSAIVVQERVLKEFKFATSSPLYWNTLIFTRQDNCVLDISIAALWDANDCIWEYASIELPLLIFTVLVEELLLGITANPDRPYMVSLSKKTSNPENVISIEYKVGGEISICIHNHQSSCASVHGLIVTDLPDLLFQP